jgi:isocitrate/isopropylmalate dehydrogenase
MAIGRTSNGISITMPFWDQRARENSKKFPRVRWDQYHIDIFTAQFVLHPDRFDVVVARIASADGATFSVSDLV